MKSFSRWPPLSPLALTVLAEKRISFGGTCLPRDQWTGQLGLFMAWKGNYGHDKSNL